MKTSNSLENEHTNHLNNMSMVHDTDRAISQAISYIPYGEVFVEQQAGGWSSPYLFNAKELDSETGLYYYGARYLDPSDAMWLSVDPLWEKYVGMTPYQYCAGNPVKLVDPDGKTVKPNSEAELEMIRNTVPENDREFIQLNNDGFIDKKILNEHSNDSENYQNLKELVNSDQLITVTLTDSYNCNTVNGKKNSKMSYISYEQYISDFEGFENFYEDPRDTEGNTLNGLSSGETGKMGKSLFPNYNAIERSLDDNCHVYINNHLSKEGAAETFSHEGYGHILLYIRTGGDYNKACHQPSKNSAGEMVDLNTILVDMIIQSKKETIRNMRK